jgi:hypothetical protein
MQKKRIRKTPLVLICVIILSIAFMSGCTKTKEKTTITKPPSPTVSPEIYKASCAYDLNIPSLINYPETYTGLNAAFVGTIDDTMPVGNRTDYLLNVGGTKDLYVCTEQNGTIIQNGTVQVWGDLLGSYQYSTTPRNQYTLPLLWAFFIEKNPFNRSVGETVDWKTLEVTVHTAAMNESFFDPMNNNTLHAENGTIFILVNITVRYLGTNSYFVYAGEFWLIDSNGSRYSYHASNFSSITLFQNEQLDGLILFEVPTSSVHGLKTQFNLESSTHPLVVEWDLKL